MGEFDSRVAVVTGAASGIGEAVAVRLHALGCRVVAADIDGAGAEGLAARLGERARAARVDVRDHRSVGALVACAVGRFGELHLAVSNAGITGPHDVLIEDASVEDWNEVLAFAVRI